MASERVERKLAAILAADVVGYSRLAGADEEGTIDRVQALRREIIDPAVAACRGRIVKTTGDGILIEFASVVDAVHCAIELQRGTATRNDDQPQDKRIAYRIGIHVGDVVVDGDDLLGDAVNVAARLEGVAEPGGICVSEDAYRQVRDRVSFRFVDAGEKPLKNIARPVRVYCLADEASAAAAVRSALSPPDKPSIAVLPFDNMSGDPEQQYFADGMVEDIITTLSRFPWLMVIARNSTFSYKNKIIDMKQVGRELGVRYALEGSVRKAAGTIRITGQLIDCATGAHLWADRFDGRLDNVFDLQDRVTANVVGAIEPRLRKAEIERATRKPTGNLDAYDYFLRGLSRFYSYTRQGNEDALKLFLKVIDLDPNYAAAYGMAAYCRHRRRSWGWTDDQKGDLHELSRLARQAAKLGKDDPLALSTAGWVTAFDLRDPELGAALIDRALALNPGEATAWWMSAFARVWLGEPGQAIVHAQRAMRLSPRDPLIHQMYAAIGNAHFVSGKYEEAAASALAALQVEPDFQPGLRLGAAAYGQLGRLEEANRLILRLRELFPDVTLSVLIDLLPYRPVRNWPPATKIQVRLCVGDKSGPVVLSVTVSHFEPGADISPASTAQPVRLQCGCANCPVMAPVSSDHFRLPIGNMANTAPGNLPRGERIKIELREFAILMFVLVALWRLTSGTGRRDVGDAGWFRSQVPRAPPLLVSAVAFFYVNRFT